MGYPTVKSRNYNEEKSLCRNYNEGSARHLKS
jgi:hypothetical protein